MKTIDRLKELGFEPQFQELSDDGNWIKADAVLRWLNQLESRLATPTEGDDLSNQIKSALARNAAAAERGYDMSDSEYTLRIAWDKTCQERDRLKKRVDELEEKIKRLTAAGKEKVKCKYCGIMCFPETEEGCYRNPNSPENLPQSEKEDSAGKKIQQFKHDNLDGPCCCGAWHKPSDFGLKDKPLRPKPAEPPPEPINDVRDGIFGKHPAAPTVDAREKGEDWPRKPPFTFLGDAVLDADRKVVCDAPYYQISKLISEALNSYASLPGEARAWPEGARACRWNNNRPCLTLDTDCKHTCQNKTMEGGE